MTALIKISVRISVFLTKEKLSIYQTFTVRSFEKDIKNFPSDENLTIRTQSRCS